MLEDLNLNDLQNPDQVRAAIVRLLNLVEEGRIYPLGEGSGANKASKRPLTQARRRWSK
jgi:hypothetical protein